MINYIQDFEKAFFKLTKFISWFKIQELFFLLATDECKFNDLILPKKTHDFCPYGYFLIDEEIYNLEFEISLANLDRF